MASSSSNLESLLNTTTTKKPIKIFQDDPSRKVFSNITNVTTNTHPIPSKELKESLTKPTNNNNVNSNTTTNNNANNNTNNNSLRKKRNQYVKITPELETDMLEVMIQEQLYSQIDNENRKLEKLRSITETFRELYPKQLADLTYRRLSNLSKVSLTKGSELFEKRRLQMENDGSEIVFNRHEQAQFDLYVQKNVYYMVYEIMTLDKDVKDDLNKAKEIIAKRLLQYQEEMKGGKSIIISQVIEIVSEMLGTTSNELFNCKLFQIQKQIKTKIKKIEKAPIETSRVPQIIEPKFMETYRMRFQNIESQINILRGRVQFVEAERARAFEERRVLVQQINDFMQEIDRTMV